jgi:hypothetical protein
MYAAFVHSVARAVTELQSGVTVLSVATVRYPSPYLRTDASRENGTPVNGEGAAPVTEDSPQPEGFRRPTRFAALSHLDSRAPVRCPAVTWVSACQQESLGQSRNHSAIFEGG